MTDEQLQLVRIANDLQVLDYDATLTSYWRVIPNEDAWECTKVTYIPDIPGWVAVKSFTGKSPDEARARAAKSICPPCRTGDCFDPRHQ